MGPICLSHSVEEETMGLLHKKDIDSLVLHDEHGREGFDMKAGKSDDM
jgi:hypothetical protein